MKYQAYTYSVYSEVLEVEADNKEAAAAKFRNGEGVLVDDALEYSRPLTELSDITPDYVFEVD